MEVTVHQGKVIRVAGAAAHPPTGGVLCAKVSRYAERSYHSERILVPLRRVGAKGEGRFEAASWEEALRDIACRLKALAAEDPETILPYSYAGTMGLVQGESIAARFFNVLGASRLDRTICASAGAEALRLTLGASVGMDMEAFDRARLIVLWGTNSIASNLHLWSRVQQAKRQGAWVVGIDPYASDTVLKCNEHLAVKPGTDAALALALMSVWIDDDTLDHDWIAAHTLGFEALRERALEYRPDRAAALCGIDAHTIRALARRMARVALDQREGVAIRMNYGVQRAFGGGNAVRAIACLPALIGAWRHVAGGVLLSTSGFFPVDHEALQRPDLLKGRSPRMVNMSQIGDALLQQGDYENEKPIKAMIVYNSNPVAVAPESAKVVAGFAREDLFTVVLEHFQTDTADYADWVLPATTQLEHLDVLKSYGHLYIVANNPAIEPLGQSRPNTQIFRDLAAAMGLDEPALFETDAQIAACAFRRSDARTAAYDWDRIAAQGWMRLALPQERNPFADGGFPTASGRVEFWSAELAERGLDPLPDFLPPVEAGGRPGYPLAMISPPARNFLNSTFVNVASLRGIEGEPVLWLNPQDAADREIAEGELVRVFNERGEQRLTARVTDRCPPGLVVAPSIWWRKLSADGQNANALTSQALTDLGRAPTFYDTAVDVEKV
jgi:anaerobic selenocysteine-containing dehydrogenase